MRIAGGRGIAGSNRSGRIAVIAAVVAVSVGGIAACTTSTGGGPQPTSAATSPPAGTASESPTPSSASSSTAPAGPTTSTKPPSSAAPTTAAPPPRLTVSGPASGAPGSPITVAATAGTLRSVTVAAPSGVAVTGTFGADRRTWSSTGPLSFATSYAVTAAAVNTTGSVQTTEASVSTAEPAALVFPALTPAPALRDIGVGQPIRVEFLHSPDDKSHVAPVDRAAIQQALRVTVNPPQPGGWYWINSSVVDYRPETFWKPGTTITVNAGIFGASFGKGAYGRVSRQATYKVHGTMVAVADGATENMNIYDSTDLSTPIRQIPISLGSTANGTPTHAGIHVVVGVEQANPYIMNSCTYGLCPPAPGAYVAEEYNAVRISDDGEFVHTNVHSLGDQGRTNVSHGCININVDDGKWFYTHFKMGDVVIVKNSGGPPLPVGDMWGDWSLPWNQWSAGNATS